MVEIKQLNTDFGMANQLEIVEGKGGLPFMEIANGKGKALELLQKSFVVWWEALWFLLRAIAINLKLG